MNNMYGFIYVILFEFVFVFGIIFFVKWIDIKIKNIAEEVKFIKNNTNAYLFDSYVDGLVNKVEPEYMESDLDSIDNDEETYSTN